MFLPGKSHGWRSLVGGKDLEFGKIPFQILDLIKDLRNSESKTF